MEGLQSKVQGNTLPAREDILDTSPEHAVTDFSARKNTDCPDSDSTAKDMERAARDSSEILNVLLTVSLCSLADKLATKSCRRIFGLALQMDYIA